MISNLNYKDVSATKNGVNRPFAILKQSQTNNEIEIFVNENQFPEICNQFLINFHSKDIAKILESINQIRSYASERSHDLLKEFQRFNIATHLVQFLDIDKTAATLKCINACLAHEDEISSFFIQNGFLTKVAQLIQNCDFLVPALHSLSNIAACSNDEYKHIIDVFSYNFFYELILNSENDINVMVKVAHLLMNLANKPPSPPILFDCLLRLSSSSFDDVVYLALWGTHNILRKKTELSSISLNNIHIYKNFAASDSDRLKRVGCMIITDIIYNIDEGFINNFDIHFLMPALKSTDDETVKSAMLCMLEIMKRKRNWVDDNYLIIFRSFIADSSFKVKSGLSEVIISLIPNCSPRDIFLLINQGIIDLFSELLDTDNITIVKGILKSMTRFICSLEMLQNSNCFFTDFDAKINFCNHIETTNLIGRIMNIVDNVDDPGLHFEAALFIDKYQGIIQNDSQILVST